MSVRSYYMLYGTTTQADTLQRSALKGYGDTPEQALAEAFPRHVQAYDRVGRPGAVFHLETVRGPYRDVPRCGLCGCEGVQREDGLWVCKTEGCFGTVTQPGQRRTESP